MQVVWLKTVAKSIRAIRTETKCFWFANRRCNGSEATVQWTELLKMYVEYCTVHLHNRLLWLFACFSFRGAARYLSWHVKYPNLTKGASNHNTLRQEVETTRFSCCHKMCRFNTEIKPAKQPFITGLTVQLISSSKQTENHLSLFHLISLKKKQKAPVQQCLSVHLPKQKHWTNPLRVLSPSSHNKAKHGLYRGAPRVFLHCRTDPLPHSCFCFSHRLSVPIDLPLRSHKLTKPDRTPSPVWWLHHDKHQPPGSRSLNNGGAENGQFWLRVLRLKFYRRFLPHQRGDFLFSNSQPLCPWPPPNPYDSSCGWGA